MVESREGLAKARGERLVHESRLTIAVIEDTNNTSTAIRDFIPQPDIP